MNIYIIFGFAIICAVTVLTIRDRNPSFAVLLSVCGGAMLLLYAVPCVSGIIGFAEDLTGLPSEVSEGIKTTVKCIGIGYLTSFAASVCNDSGQKFLGDKVILAGRICVLLTGLPLFGSFAETVKEILI